MDEMSRSVGEIQGRLDLLEQNITRELEDLRKSINNISAVPVSEFQAKSEQLSDEMHKNEDDLQGISRRISDLDNRLTKHESSLSWKIGEFFDNAIVKAIGAGFIVVAVLALYVSYDSQISKLKAEIQKTNQAITSIEDK